MSEIPGAGDSPANELQFDRVEYAAHAPAATCRVCDQPLQYVYYEVNGQPFCESCREQLEKAVKGSPGVGRFARATLYGSLAGLAGAAIYFGVREATGYEFGLIAVLVGLMIGNAVKKGSNARGGWLYQGLAMFLTYNAIVLTYIPPVIQAIGAQFEEKAAAAKLEQGEQPAGAAEVAGDDVAQPDPSVWDLLLALAFLAGLAYALPVLIGFDSPMGLIIVGFALYEAWAINRRAPIVINGPFQIGQAGAGSAVHVEPAG